MGERMHIVQQLEVLPTGAVVDEHWELGTYLFCLTVQWRGPRTETGRGGYAVKHHSKELSRTGKWGYPEPFQQHQYRWTALDEAIAAAEKVVDTVTVNGRTFADWKETWS